MSVAYDLAICPDVSPFPAAPPPARAPRPAGRRRGGRPASVTYLVPPARTTTWRLTRRGVRVATLAVAVLCLALIALARHDAPAASPSHAVPAGSVVTVGPDDSLWTIATRVAPDRDPRAEVADLQAANHLRDDVVRAGQQLRVP
ncbi:MAG: LysM peptidoglycan-binding domain-containing protein [Jatrophihabitans sp.]|uniref:LysM peptidoglycan-binding domain-containing protein n=1 Tax=Jatrophihabitans sp. TaxID=1932789 RepID=UPI003F7E7C34